MQAPTIYAEWVAMLELFSRGDDTVLEYINAGSFVIDAGTAQRFYINIEKAYKVRKQKWLNIFQRSFEIQPIQTYDKFGIVLRNAKQNLLPLSRFILVKAFPDDIKEVLRKDLEGCVEEVKQSLKNNIVKTNKDKEKMLLMLQSFGLPAVSYIKEAQGCSINKSTMLPSDKAGGKIIF